MGALAKRCRRTSSCKAIMMAEEEQPPIGVEFSFETSENAIIFLESGVDHPLRQRVLALELGKDHPLVNAQGQPLFSRSQAGPEVGRQN